MLINKLVIQIKPHAKYPQCTAGRLKTSETKLHRFLKDGVISTLRQSWQPFKEKGI